MIVVGWMVFGCLGMGYVALIVGAFVLQKEILTQANSRLPGDKQFLARGSSRTSELPRQDSIWHRAICSGEAGNYA